MRIPLQLLSFVLLLSLSVSCNSTVKERATDTDTDTTATLLGAGRQPQIAVDTKGIARVVYGLQDKIYCVTSKDNGETFSEPVLVGQLKGLYLGMSMGPQIASSKNYSVVTAIDKQGDIHTYSLNHTTDKWVKAAAVNDVPGVAPEGLMSIASDEQDTFYAVWLDVRNNKQNKIVFASTTGGAEKWSGNKVVYESPDSTVCECCKPSIAVEGRQVYLMFRNWIDGSRDFYLTKSTDNGQQFSQPQKLGTGTWKLKGCPMDGGGILLDSKNVMHTAWQREGSIFYVQPGQQEVQIGKGRNCRISGKTNPVIAWKNGTDLKLKFLNADTETVVGKGSYIETAEMPDNKTLCVWEDERKIHFRKI
ncbi:hypothetical protein [Pontibacter sp. HSC-36F09]|uniref:hypothetical protein n=1 Tax=Pontibacter sp. HSC-36F09 TaxID=2910966 RepID=UPI00209E294E|nr:hypothetical protein [Pontibacter sp. HSC-36F09]MCP2042323.1 hypothetical protein [Pontibacter sp. HSC-36F09]